MVNNLKIEIRTYNNKSRKGDYIVIKEGKVSRAYKYDESFPLDFYVEVARKSIESKGQKGYKPHKKQIMTELKEVIKGKESKYLQQIGLKYEKYKNLKPKDYIKKGQTRVKTTLRQLEEDPVKYYRKLLRPLVLDEELLKIVMQNADKFRHRFWYYLENRAIVLNKDGNNKEKIVAYHENNIKTPNELIINYRDRYKFGKVLQVGQLQTLAQEVGGINFQSFLGDSKERIRLLDTIVTIVFTKSGQTKPQLNRSM